MQFQKQTLGRISEELLAIYLNDSQKDFVEECQNELLIKYFEIILEEISGEIYQKISQNNLENFSEKPPKEFQKEHLGESKKHFLKEFQY